MTLNLNGWVFFASSCENPLYSKLACIIKKTPKRWNVVFPRGFEPPTYGLGNRCSILLSYENIFCFSVVF